MEYSISSQQITALWGVFALALVVLAARLSYLDIGSSSSKLRQARYAKALKETYNSIEDIEVAPQEKACLQLSTHGQD